MVSYKVVCWLSMKSPRFINLFPCFFLTIWCNFLREVHCIVFCFCCNLPITYTQNLRCSSAFDLNDNMFQNAMIILWFSAVILVVRQLRCKAGLPISFRFQLFDLLLKLSDAPLSDYTDQQRRSPCFSIVYLGNFPRHHSGGISIHLWYSRFDSINFL